MTLPIPSVTITVQDNGASASLSVPQPNVQLKIGCAVGGTVNHPFATTNPQSLQNQFIGGPLVEAGGLVCQAGNVCVAISCPIVTHGTATAVVTTVPNSSTSVVTTTLDSTNGAWDTYYFVMRPVVTGTIGTAPGPSIQISLDAGRNWGPPISLGTATTYIVGAPFSPATVGGTGIQLNFAAGTLVAPPVSNNPVYDTFKFSTVGPLWNDAGVAAALTAFFASQYAVAGVGSAHIVGTSGSGDIAAFQTSIQAGVAGFVFTRALVELRDALAPAAYGGSGETEATWMAALELIGAGATAQPRIYGDGGYYNTPSAYANASAGLPAYRRPLAWSHAVRRTQIGLEVRAGRVLDGPYGNIVVNPATDPSDGFIYHDERVTPGLNAANIGSALTWPKKGQGFFQCQEPLFSTPGSQFTEVAIGNVLDAACDIGYAAGVDLVSDNVLVQANGTLDLIALNQIQGEIQKAENEGLVQTPLVSSVAVTVSPTQNVSATGIIPITIAVTPDGYVNAVQETINLNTGN